MMKHLPTKSWLHHLNAYAGVNVSNLQDRSQSKKLWLNIRASLTLFVIASLCLSTRKVASPAQPLLVPMTAVFNEIERSQVITLCAFTLSPHGKTVRLLEAAAKRGARVSVVLDVRAFGSARKMNIESTSALTQAGVIVHPSSGTLHLKAAVFDGQRIYLSDKNFTSTGSNEIVLEDPFPSDRLLVERAMLGIPSSNDHLWLRKSDALKAEAILVDDLSSHNIDVQTESFGQGTPVFAAIERRAKLLDHVRLLVYRSEYIRSATERGAVALLASEGVAVRIATTNEKLAVVGKRAFVGSANQTHALPNQIDFGFYISDPDSTAEIQSHFNANWTTAAAI